MYFQALVGIVKRDLYYGLSQKSMVLSAVVRALLWMLIVGGGGAFIGRVHAVAYPTYLFPGLLGMTLLFSGVMAALITVDDREKGMSLLFKLAPVTLLFILTSRVLGAFCIAIFHVVLIFSVLYFLPQVHAAIHYLSFFAAVLMTALLTATLGLFLASISHRAINFSGVVNFVIFPLFFLSGALFPITTLPSFLQWLVFLNPFAHAVSLLQRGCYISTAFDYLPSIVIVIASIVLFFGLSVYFFKQVN